MADAVLAQVEQSVVALDRAAGSSAADLPAFEALMEDLVDVGLLDIEVEALPDAEELARRKQGGAGLSRPELAVLLAYARSELARSIEASPLSGFEALRSCAVDYFPPEPRQAFLDLIPEHPLFSQLVASELADEVIVRMGAVWAHEVAAETGRQLWEVAGAYWAAREVLGAGPLFAAVDSLAWSISLEAEAAWRDYLTAGLGRLTRWYLARRGRIDPGAVIAADQPVAGSLGEGGSTAGPLGLGVAPGDETLAGRGVAAELIAQGVPDDMAFQVARMVRSAVVGEWAEVARAAERDLETVAEAYRVVNAGLALEGVEKALSRRETFDRWERREFDLLADDLARTRAMAVTRALQSHPDLSGYEAAREWLAMRPGPLADRVGSCQPRPARNGTKPRTSGPRPAGAR